MKLNTIKKKKKEQEVNSYTLVCSTATLSIN